MMCAIGSEDTVYAFSSIGFEPVIADSRDKVMSALERDYDVFLVEEGVAKAFENALREIKARGKVVIEIPGVGGSTGYTKERIRRMVINAVGMDIFGEVSERERRG